VRTISGSLVQVHPELEESARICGLGPVRALCRITLPLVRPRHQFELDPALQHLHDRAFDGGSCCTTRTPRTFSILSSTSGIPDYFSRVASLSLLQLFIGVVVMVIVNSLATRVAPGESQAAA